MQKNHECIVPNTLDGLTLASCVENDNGVMVLTGTHIYQNEDQRPGYDEVKMLVNFCPFCGHETKTKRNDYAIKKG